ncbi:MAG: type II secretion system protein [bacterium]|nr:type II secretion system protein [bacterium]
MTGDRKRGFTLIELLVAMGLFVIVLSITSAIFIRGLRSQKVITSLIAVNDNASLSLEQMAREIRTGICFKVSDIDGENWLGNKLEFINARGESVAYDFAVGGLIDRIVDGASAYITSDDVVIRRLEFVLQWPLNDDDKQVRVTIMLSVGARAEQLQAFVTNIQTTVSPRILDTSYSCD